jgi:hypothetical protein
MSAKRRVVALSLSFVIAFVTMPQVALAAVQGSCPSNDPTKVLLWENAIGDTTDGNDQYWKCSSDPDLSDDDHTLPGNCKSIGFGSTSWYDCVSSVSVWLPAGYCINFYVHSNYIGSMNNTVQGPVSGSRSNLPSNDALSSFIIYEC